MKKPIVCLMLSFIAFPFMQAMEEQDEALKQAIEASLKEEQQRHRQAQSWLSEKEEEELAQALAESARLASETEQQNNKQVKAELIEKESIELPTEIKHFEQWSLLPSEVQSLILSFTPQAGTYKEFTKLKSVNRQFQQLMNDPGILEGFFRKLIEKDPEQAGDFFITAAINDDPIITRAFLRAGIDPNTKNKSGMPILTCVIEFGHKKIAKLLLQFGADLNAPDVFGFTPLLRAIVDKQKGLIDLLLQRGASVSGADKDGFTPLMAAAEVEGYKSIFDKILKKGADINAQDTKGLNVLHYAAQGNGTEVARELIAKGFDVNGATVEGKTPLMLAATNGNAKLVDMLLKKGARIDQTDAHGWNALHYAALCECGSRCECPLNECASETACIEVAKLLLKNGADIDSINTDGGQTAEEIAEYYDNKQIKNYLAQARAERVGR